MSCHPPRVTWTGKTKNKKNNNNNEEEKKKTEQEKKKEKKKKAVLMQSLTVSVELTALKAYIHYKLTQHTHKTHECV